VIEDERLKFITDEDDDYPERLKCIFAPPLYLYVKGELKDYENGLGVIGSRNCTMYGKEVALSFSKIFASHGICIISGMAKGVDGFAHEGALSGGGYTMAVLGFGACDCYPAEHRTLKERIAGTGCLVSEYHPKTAGNPRFFPARNRIIAALSDALLVVEAAKKSGTIITVDFALSIGKTIYAVPGRIGDPLSEGCMELIKHGCRPLTDPGDILQDFGYTIKNSKLKNKVDLDENQRLLLGNIEQQVKNTEDIIRGTGIAVSEALKILFSLEMKGLIKQPVTGAYIRAV
jgi:DNA processing protein